MFGKKRPDNPRVIRRLMNTVETEYRLDEDCIDRVTYVKTL